MITDLQTTRLYASVLAPHRDGEQYRGWMPCINWCNETFGPPQVGGWNYQTEGVFEFDHEHKLSIFLLKWG